jgi:hypothetical protein
MRRDLGALEHMHVEAVIECRNGRFEANGARADDGETVTCG